MRHWRLISILALSPCLVCPCKCEERGNPDTADAQVAEVLEPIRASYGLPALVGAIVTSDGVISSGVVGIRKVGSNLAATIQDDWHLGSDTKAMTATLIGTLIDDGRLRFQSTIGEVFPDLSPSLPDSIREITVEELLAHRSGLPHDPEGGWGPLSRSGSIVDQRARSVRAAGDAVLLAPPGSSYNYSNWGYVILGAIAERIEGKPWEELLRLRVLGPLKMEHVGFGGTGTPGKIDQPWPHKNGKPTRSNGPEIDNPPVMAPAGTVHCPIVEWAKFIENELKGLQGVQGLLSPATFKQLHTPAFAGDYAGGWRIVNRTWAKGNAYTHTGSNTMNVAIAWIAPNRNVAFLVCTNDGEGTKACNEAVLALLRLYEGKGRSR